MKKFLCCVLTFSICMFTGCTKNYKTVEEYEAAMQTVKNKNISYTMDATQKLGSIELYYKSYIKGDKWKVETSMNGGNSYMTTVLYDGKDLLSYSQGSPYAMVNPMMDTFNSDDDTDAKKFAINSQNPVYSLYDWKDSYGLFSFNDDIKPIFENNKATKNGFECRMIKFSSDREACISDKYGVAVYQKITTEDNKHPGNTQEMELNLIKIDNNDIDDAIFELPQGVKKTSLDKMLDDLSSMMKSSGYYN